MRLVNRALPRDVKLFAPEGSAGGCAAGDCLPEAAPEAAEPEPEPEPELPAAPARSGGGSDVERWRRAVEALREASPRHGKSLSNARFLGFVPEGVRVAFPPEAAFHRAQVTGMSRALVEGELSRALGRPVRLVEDSTPEALQAAPRSIAEVEATDRASRERGIEARVRSHPALRAVVRHLGGALEHISYLEAAPRPTEASGAADDDAPLPD